MDDVQEQQSRRLAQLGILLQALHVLFGVTAILGMFVAHMRQASTQGTIYHSHLTWQLVTFWCALPGYAVAAWLWSSRNMHWPVIVVAAFVAYRLLINIRYWLAEKPINRIL